MAKLRRLRSEVADTAYKKLRKSLIALANVKTPAADAEDFPLPCQLSIFCLYVSAILATFLTLLIIGFNQNKEATFISLSSSAGFCKSNSSDKSCCSIAKTINQEVEIDSYSIRNVDDSFQNNYQIYGVNFYGFSGNNNQYLASFESIETDIKQVSVTLGSNRDYAWNIVMWVSYEYHSDSNIAAEGYLQFYFSGDVDTVFAGRDIKRYGYSSNASDLALPSCQALSAPTVSYSDYTLTVEHDLDIGDNCVYGNWGSANGSSSSGLICLNPCPGILSPQAMGYYVYGKSTAWSWTMDMATVMIAIAINYGSLRLELLQENRFDPKRLVLLNFMKKAGYISQETADATSSYSDAYYLPMDSLYCTTYGRYSAEVFSDERLLASCFVRVGNLLLYPIINSLGWSETGDGYSPSGKVAPPLQCNSSSVEDSLKAFRFCNQHNLVVGFVYFPVLDNDAMLQKYQQQQGNRRERKRRARHLLQQQQQTALDADEKEDASIPTAQLNTASATTEAATTQATTTVEVTDDYLEDLSGYYYYYNSPVYNFSNVIDDGCIFRFAYESAMQRNASVDGDMTVPTRAYNAMLKTVGYDLGSKRTFTDEFDVLCEGCAMFAVQFQGYHNRKVSPNGYDFNTDPVAFNNTGYNAEVFIYMKKYPPFKLIEDYYNCVRSDFQALYEAAGIAASNTQLLVSVFFLVYMYFLVEAYRAFFGVDDFIPKFQRVKDEKRLQQDHQMFVQLMIENLADGENSQTELKSLARHIMNHNNENFHDMQAKSQKLHMQQSQNWKFLKGVQESENEDEDGEEEDRISGKNKDKNTVSTVIHSGHQYRDDEV